MVLHIALHKNKVSGCHLHKLKGNTCRGCIALDQPLKGKEWEDFINCHCLGQPDYTIICSEMHWDMGSEHLDKLLENKIIREGHWIKRINEICSGDWKINKQTLDNLLWMRSWRKTFIPHEPEIEIKAPKQEQLLSFTNSGGILH